MNTLLLTLVMATPTSPSPKPDLRFDASQFALKRGDLEGEEVTYRAVEGVVYVRKPVDAKYQTLNVYAPEAYFSGGTVNGYTVRTAPIFFPNSVGGYMPGVAAAPGAGMDRRSNTLLRALAHGYVVVAPGARGRSLKDPEGRYTGKAPAGIVDLKAAIRYVRANRGLVPGNVERIVSNGTSAGGALSALLGASGDSEDYAPYLKSLGAAEARDDVWAVSAYCPITNLEHADAAYEWLLNGVNESKAFGGGRPTMPVGEIPKGGLPGGLPSGGPPQGGGGLFGQPGSKAGPMSAEQIANSAALKAEFPAYVNGLNLKGPDGKPLSLDASGNGPFKEYVASFVLASARAAQAKGTDVTKTPWVVVKDGEAVGIDWDGYVRSVGRMKQTSAFDSPDLTTGENNEFGSETVDNRHFTEFGMAQNKVAGAIRAEEKIVKMMNPMPYIGAKGVKTSPHWRIRHGAIDRDTSLAIPLMLAIRLQNRGYGVDVAIPWDTPHSGDYDLNELFAWIDVRAKR
ncbi:alpha/beta hydrolase [bacterium]|nr:MAG: alpha/beta hydrolase [bacterium]